MYRGRRFTPVVVAALSLALVAAACGSSKGATSNPTSGGSNAAAGTKTLTVAVIDPLSGPLASSGQAAENGAKAGAAYLNAGNAKAKNIHYTVISRDSQASPTVDNALSRQLIQQGVRFFIGDDLTSTGFAAEQPIFNQVHALSFSSVPGVFPQGGVGTHYPGVFGDGGDDSHYVIPFVNYFKQQNVKKVAILYANYQDVAIWGQQAGALSAKDGMGTSSEAVPLTASDVTAQLRTLQGSGADALLAYALTPTLAGAVAQGLNQIGWAPKPAVILGATSQVISSLPARVQAGLISGPAATTFLSTSTNAQPTGLTAQYYKYYAPLAGEVAGKYDTVASNGAFYFDAMLILDQAIAQAQSTDPQAVEMALDSGTSFVASRGSYVYGPHNRAGPVESDFSLYHLTAAGCPTGICLQAGS